MHRRGKNHDFKWTMFKTHVCLWIAMEWINYW